MAKKIIALVSEPVSGDALKSAVGPDSEAAEVLVVAPALESRTPLAPGRPRRRHPSGPDAVQEETVERMDGGGRGRGR